MALSSSGPAAHTDDVHVIALDSLPRREVVMDAAILRLGLGTLCGERSRNVMTTAGTV